MRIGLFICALLNVSLCVAQQTWPVVRFDSCTFQAIGHRGYSMIYPENTLLSIEEAFKRGVKYCEVDVSVTKDDQYVLFHDEHSIYRTTNGQGRIDEINYADLRNMDAGSWKGSQFKGVYIPTLEEAILIAEKYDAYLYLDTKSYRPDLMKKALDATHASPARIISAMNDLQSAQDFRAILPNTPWVWYEGGNYPANINDDQFYTDCINLGCIAFEVSSPDSIDSLWTAFETKVHQHGSKLWAFTENDNDRALLLRSAHVDGIETDRAWNFNQLLCNGIAGDFGDSLTTGNWRFTNSLAGTGVGSKLRTRNYEAPTDSMLPVFKRCSDFGIPFLDSMDAEVMLVPAQDAENGLLVYTNFATDDFGTEDPSFTVMMDLMIPTASMGQWISLFQTSPGNSNDADLFINPAGEIGIRDVYHGSLVANTWYRIAFTVDLKNGLLNKYVDGHFIGSNPINSNRWTVFNSSPRGENQGFLVFSDDDGETQPLYMSALQIRDYVLDSVSVKAMGKVTADGFHIGNADLWNVNILGAITDSTILDYDHQTFYVLVPSHFNLAASNLSFDLSYGAKASITPGTTLNMSSGQYSLTVTSQDLLTTKPWKIVVKKQQSLGLKDIESNQSALIYPNPSSGIFHIRLKESHAWQFVITDLIGREYKNGAVTDEQNGIDISGFESGMYLVVLFDEEGRKEVCKVLKN